MRTPSRPRCSTRSPEASRSTTRSWQLAFGLVAILSAGTAGADPSFGPECGGVPATGAPLYVEGRTVGGALATHGSHFGLKAIIDPEAGVPAPAAAPVALSDGRTSGAGRITALWLEGGAGGERSVRFEPWGWEDRGLGLEVKVFWVDTDVFVMAADEAATALVVGAAGARASGTAAVVEAPGETVLWVADPAAALTVAQSGDASRLQGTSGVYVIGVGDDEGAARAAGERGLSAVEVAGSAAAAFDREASRFGALLADAACTDVAGAEALQRLAVAALASSAYAPRGQLTRSLLSRARSLDNGFYGADVPRQAAAIASWDPALAQDAFLGQLEAVADQGDFHVPYRFDETLAIEPGSMTPVQAQSILAAIRLGLSFTAQDLGEIAERLDHYSDWLHLDRDFGEQGLLVHGSHIESGWPDSPRWPLEGARSEAIFYEAPDVSADYYEYLEALAGLQELAGSDPGDSLQQARELREAIEDELWDEDHGVYQDLDTRTGELGTVVSPHVLWPLAAGITLDEERAERVLETTLLDPARLLGQDDGAHPPLPSVAYDHPRFDALSATATASRLGSIDAALRALFRYGREAEAEQLRERTIALVASRPAGLYDRYLVGGDRCPADIPPLDDPPVFQPGEAAAVLLGILHGDHERERFVMELDTRIAGRIAEARFIDDEARLFVAHPERGRLPRVVLTPLEEGVLADRGPVRLSLVETCDVARGTPIEVELPALAPFRFSSEEGGPEGRTDGTFTAEVGSTYVIRPLSVQGGGCTCDVAGHGDGGLPALSLALLVLLGRKGATRPRGRRSTPCA